MLGSARYEGWCSATGAALCLDERPRGDVLSRDFRLDLVRVASTGALASAVEELRWRCTGSVEPALAAAARYRHGPCDGPGPPARWVPPTHTPQPVVRCDGERISEPRVETSSDEPFVGGAPIGLRFHERGLEWVDEMQDCPVRGMFRALAGD